MRDIFKEIAVLCSFLSNLPSNPEIQTNLKSLVLIFQFQIDIFECSLFECRTCFVERMFTALVTTWGN